MADATATLITQGVTDFGDLPQAVIMSTGDVSAEDMKSNIDLLVSELYKTASSGLVLQAGLRALHEVRSTWRFMQKNTDELTRTGFYMQLVDRILHDASIYGPRQHHQALALQELVFNLNLAFTQDVSTPLNLRFLRRRLICLLDQFDSEMRGRSTDGLSESKSRYANLCAFASALVREDVHIFAWEDIMRTAFRRAQQNEPSEASTQNGGGTSLETWKAYLSGAQAWANCDILRKSLRDGSSSRVEWQRWQRLFMEADSITTDGDPSRQSFSKPLREIQMALDEARGHKKDRHTRAAYVPKARLLRIPART